MLTKRIYIVILLLTLLPGLSQAMPCHCFSARDFDPQEPASADPFYLATSQNSFFSVVFDIAKKKVVFAKQKPRATAEGLWILNWVSMQTDNDIKTLKKLVKDNGSWQSALKLLAGQSDSLPLPFMNLVNSAADNDRLSQFIVDHLLIANAGISAKELKSLRNVQASNEESILAAFLAIKISQSPSEIFQIIASGKTTWGTLMLTSGMKGRDMVEEIKSLIKEAKFRT